MDQALDLVWRLAAELYGDRGKHMPAFVLLGQEGEGRLDAALAVVAHDYYESDAHATAHMFWALVQDHPFQDGNKRFAVVATNVTLILNGLFGLMSNDEWERLALSVARREIQVNELRLFFEDRVTLIDAIDHERLDALAGPEGAAAIAELTRIAEALAREIADLSAQ